MLVVMSPMGLMCQLGTPEGIILEWDMSNKASPHTLLAVPVLL